MPCPSASSLKMHKDICGIKASWPSHEFNVKHYNAHYPNIKYRVHYIDWMFVNCFTQPANSISKFSDLPYLNTAVFSSYCWCCVVVSLCPWRVLEESWSLISHSLDSGVDLAGLKDTYFLTIVSYNLFHVWYFQVSTILSSREHPTQRGVSIWTSLHFIYACWLGVSCIENL